MRRRLFAAFLTAVVALSAAVRHADDLPSSTSAAKRDRHVGTSSHVTERYINRKLDELETRLGRRLADQTKRLNQSITIHYLEKVTSNSSDCLYAQKSEHLNEIGLGDAQKGKQILFCTDFDRNIARSLVEM